MKKRFILEITGTEEEINQMLDIANSYLENETGFCNALYSLEEEK